MEAVRWRCFIMGGLAFLRGNHSEGKNDLHNRRISKRIVLEHSSEWLMLVNNCYPPVIKWLAENSPARFCNGCFLLFSIWGYLSLSASHRTQNHGSSKRWSSRPHPGWQWQMFRVEKWKSSGWFLALLAPALNSAISKATNESELAAQPVCSSMGCHSKKPQSPSQHCGGL